MPNCIIVTGNIGCGKTTLSKEYVDKGYLVISRDQFRYGIGGGKYIFNLTYEPIIRKTELYLLRLFLELGVNIYIDEVGINKHMRCEYLKMLKELPRLSQKEAVDNRMKDPHGQPDRALWESVWNKFNEIYEAPAKEEGFHLIIKIGDHDGKI
jgi:hypothetical protein